MSTTFPSGQGLADNRKWYVVDAAGQTVGRLATEVARVLSGKNKPIYTPFLDTGDHVIVINARRAVFKGSKAEQKLYRHHTLYPGGLRTIGVKDQFAKHPERVIELAVRGMLPKSKLGRAMGKKLKVYGDADHPHTAQRPEALKLSERAAAARAK
ncbi:MAG: 50S ribosomal protein L13 [Acidobacteria bacterium]|nr:50S ribosomal protein L13 [Acidobacteriota bacterium]MCA1640560.1 50S ribosomal protein L13 [Acidobacteriota bacterium]